MFEDAVERVDFDFDRLRVDFFVGVTLEDGVDEEDDDEDGVDAGADDDEDGEDSSDNNAENWDREDWEDEEGEEWCVKDAVIDFDEDEADDDEDDDDDENGDKDKEADNKGDESFANSDELRRAFLYLLACYVWTINKTKIIC